MDFAQKPLFRQRDKNILYISDLPPNTIETDLNLFLQKYKDDIIRINIIPHFSSLQNQNQNLRAKVVFKDSESANNARIEMNLRKLKGHAIRLMWEEKDNSIRYNNSTNLFIKNIPFNKQPREVYEYFMQFGDIFSCKLIEDINGNHLGYGYITYYEPESAQSAIRNCDGKNIWGSILEVKYFKKKNERMSTFGPQVPKIYLTNFPGNYNENEIIQICKNYGEINYCKINTETIGRVYAIVGFSKIESVELAKEKLNGKNISGYNLYCEIYKEHKNDANANYNLNNFQRNFSSQINDNKMCNLYIKNIPFTVNDSMLKKVFSKFGEIKSAKIEMYKVVNKIGDEFKEIPTSKGFGYVLFENPESAKNAREELNGKFLPGFESWNHPLTIEYLIPKSQRNFMLSQEYNNNDILNRNINNNINNNRFYNGINNQFNNCNTPQIPNRFNYNQQNQNLNQYGRKDYSYLYQNSNVSNNNNYQNDNNNNQTNNELSVNSEMFNINYFNNIENNEDKKSYLGEIIFKQIEEHPLAQEHNMTMDTIGKITGMIINIDNINEIIETCQNKKLLTSRINEALGLLGQK